MRAWIRLPSPAMGVALIALVVALGGTTYAAVRIGTKQIKNNAITSPKIRNGQVKPHEDSMLAITTDGRKAALDFRLVAPMARFDPRGKVAACVREVMCYRNDKN